LGEGQNSMRVAIKPIRSLPDFKRVEDIQRTIWGFRDTAIIPYTQMITVQHNGGTLLGAYVDSELVGFVYGYLGMSGGTLYLFSMRAGVLPAYQSMGLGAKLKLAQREQMLRSGIDLIVWTYDPLLGPNAMLNLEKLGGIARAYVRDIYGSVSDNPFQAGLSLDRFLLEWHLLSDRVRGRIAGNYQPPTAEEWVNEKRYRLVNDVNWRGDLPYPTGTDLALDDPAILVQVPSNINDLKRCDLAVAREWRNVTRSIFETYFRRGYVVTGFARDKKREELNIYNLEKTSFPSPIDYFSWAKGIEDGDIKDEA